MFEVEFEEKLKFLKEPGSDFPRTQSEHIKYGIETLLSETGDDQIINMLKFGFLNSGSKFYAANDAPVSISI